MPEVPQNIERAHLLRAIGEIRQQGVPSRAQSNTYDVVHEGERFPPKLVVSIANRYANGEELDRQTFNGGVNTDAFRLLEREGFKIEPKRDVFESGYQAIKKQFLAALPDFTSFDDDERYLSTERRYKDELVGIFEKKIRPLINREEWKAVGEQVVSILNVPLTENDGHPQNIVGWRYIYAIQKLEPAQLSRLGESVAKLISDDLGLEQRLTQFFSGLSQVAGDDSYPSAAASRSLASFLLTLSDPKRHLFLKTREISQAVKNFKKDFRWDRQGLTADEVRYIESLAQRILERLEEEGWKPRDLIDVQSMLWIATTYEEPGLHSPDTSVAIDHREKPVETMSEPLNQILYGPPGTGKTFFTVNKALKILDPEFIAKNSTNRAALKQRFEELREKGRIRTVTFHQSFSYEDFVEGLRASTNEEGQIQYEIEPGIFKRICDAARAKATVSTDATIDLSGRRIWKMSLGNTQGSDAYVYDDCIANNYILLGYGRELDYSKASSRKAIEELHKESGEDVEKYSYSITAIHLFRNVMQDGDLVVVSDGNHKFRAIAEIKGDYRFLDDRDIDNYKQSREVTWLRVYTPSLPREQLMINAFSQMTLYELKPTSIDMSKLADLLASTSEASEGPVSSSVDGASTINARVLIIDEINRGNVANIFGELITLIEPSKREGASEVTEVTLPYSKEPFSVPRNLYMIGTMNTADRSLVHLDTALRRRFVFEAMMPSMQVLSDHGIDEVEGVEIIPMVEVMNQRIELLYDREHTLGHSFFLPLTNTPTIACLADIFDRQILPLLEEYFFEDWSKIRQVLGDDQKTDETTCFVVPVHTESSIQALLSAGTPQELMTRAYKRNHAAFSNPDAYRLIYEKDEA